MGHVTGGGLPAYSSACLWCEGLISFSFRGCEGLTSFQLSISVSTFFHLALCYSSYLTFDTHTCLCSGMCWQIYFSLHRFYEKLCPEACLNRSVVQWEELGSEQFHMSSSCTFHDEQDVLSKMGDETQWGDKGSTATWAAELAAREQTLLHLAPQMRAWQA